MEIRGKNGTTRTSTLWDGVGFFGLTLTLTYPTSTCAANTSDHRTGSVVLQSSRLRCAGRSMSLFVDKQRLINFDIFPPHNSLGAMRSRHRRPGHSGSFLVSTKLARNTPRKPLLPPSFRGLKTRVPWPSCRPTCFD